MIKLNKTEALQWQNEALTVKGQSLFLCSENPHIRNLKTNRVEYFQKTLDLKRVTAELQMALPGRFSSKVSTPLGKEAFHKAAVAGGYEVVVDTHGTLLWEDQADAQRPVLVLNSENVNREYRHVDTAQAYGNEVIYCL